MADRPAVPMNNQIIEEFPANEGKVGGPFKDATLLLLHTTGAKSVNEHINPVMYFRIDGKVLIVGSYAGADVDSAWVHNLRTNPRAQVEIGTDSYDVEARQLARDERDAAYSNRRSGTGIRWIPGEDGPGHPRLRAVTAR